MNITILWSGLASYSVTLFKELSRQGCNIQLVYQPTDSEAPYQKFDLSFCKEAIEDSRYVKIHIDSIVYDFKPDCIFMSSWCFPHFMKLAKKMRKNGVLVISAMDNQWYGSIKQYIGVMSSRLFLKPCIDTFLVSGDRQAYFARKLGYEDVLYGLYAADINKFTNVIPILQRPKKFIFIGRLTASKGIKELIQAYAAYREVVVDPWDLIVAGTGPLSKWTQGIDGIEAIGFIQPDDLPKLMNEARCFILPSRREPWGVVIQEAAAAGLPVIATYSCGATSMFVRDGINGYIVSSRKENIKNAMLRIHGTPSERLEKMSITSSALAEQLNPQLIAEYIIDSIKNIRLMSNHEL